MKPRHDDGTGYKRGAGPYSKSEWKFSDISGMAGKHFIGLKEQRADRKFTEEGRTRGVKRNDAAPKDRRNWGVDDDKTGATIKAAKKYKDYE